MLELDISRSNMLVGVFLVGGALLGVGFGFVALNYDNNNNNPDADKVTAEDVIVTAETNEQGEQTGVVRIENTADKRIPVYTSPGKYNRIDANNSIQYSSEEIPLFFVRNQEGDDLYLITNDSDAPDGDRVRIERNPEPEED